MQCHANNCKLSLRKTKYSRVYGADVEHEMNILEKENESIIDNNCKILISSMRISNRFSEYNQN